MNIDLLKKLDARALSICRMPGCDLRWGVFADPVDIVEVSSFSDVRPALDMIGSKTERDGLFAVGYVAYEAAGGLDPACGVIDNVSFPLVHFNFYDKPHTVMDSDEMASLGRMMGAPAYLKPSIEKDAYDDCIRKVHAHIREGDIYQANFTFRTEGILPDGVDPLDFFFSLFRAHPVPYAAYVNDGDLCHVSLSPELFLERSGQLIKSSPMKGTASRAGEFEADRRAADFLPSDPKNTAENLMIVDMVRNDLGRVCRTGSIRVEPMFGVETYRSVHQMVSTVHGELNGGCGLSDIFYASFPPASITGAPKFRAMEIIREMEKTPRNIYTGSIGCVAPGGDFLFNVAIRTISCRGDKFSLGIGGGIVHDSASSSEWEEALLKSRFLDFAGEPDFCILETMLYRPGNGVAYLEEHIARAMRSQLYFGRKWIHDEFEKALSDCISGISVTSRIRLTVDRGGHADAKAFSLVSEGWGMECANIMMSPVPTSKKDVFLYHKTTNRKLYDEARHTASENSCDEIIFTNCDGFVTEGSITNIFMRRGGEWSTPELSCGLLDGIWRRDTIRRLGAFERKITVDELLSADEIMIGNSVRGGVRAVFLPK